MATIVARQLADGTLVEVLPDGTTRPLPDRTDWAALSAMSDEEKEAAALSDPDAQPLSEEAIARALQGPHPRLVRFRLALSQAEFCARYQIPLDELIAWETRKAEPGPVVRAYMKLIMKDPQGVARTLAYRPEPSEAAQSDATAKPRAAE